MTISFQKCNANNKLIEGDCASDDEIEAWFNTHVFLIKKSIDIIDFEGIRTGLPVYQKIMVDDMGSLAPIHFEDKDKLVLYDCESSRRSDRGNLSKDDCEAKNQDTQFKLSGQ